MTEHENVISDVMALLGMCATTTKGTVGSNRKKKFEPTTEMGRKIRDMVEYECARRNTKRP
jgi:hypothetical protein